MDRSLANGPPEEEPMSKEEIRSVGAARASFDCGEIIPHEQVLAELGLSMEDSERMSRTPLDPREPDR